MARKTIKTDPAKLLGKRIRELRKDAGLTQEELGEKSGISYKYLGSIERGLENPSFKHLARIARALHANLDELFKLDHLEPDRARILRDLGLLIARMSETELKTVYRLIKALKP